MLFLLFQNNQNAVPPYAQQVPSAPLTQVARGVKSCTKVAPGDTATLILSANPYRKGARIANAHATETAYLGRDATVTTANGMPLLKDTALDDPASVDAWYAIMGSAVTGDLRIIEYQ